MNLIEFQEKNSKTIKKINKYLSIIQTGNFSENDRYGLYNSAIIYNNKISEIIRIFEKHNLNFFDNILWPVVDEYLQESLDFCIERVRTVYYGTKYFRFLTLGIQFFDPSVDISAYKYFTYKIDSFDLHKQILYAIFNYYNQLCLTKPQEIVKNIEIIKSEMIKTLTALDMHEHIEDCIKILDVCYECDKNNIKNKRLEQVRYNPRYENNEIVQTYKAEKPPENCRTREELMDSIENEENHRIGF